MEVVARGHLWIIRVLHLITSRMLAPHLSCSRSWSQLIKKLASACTFRYHPHVTLPGSGLQEMQHLTWFYQVVLRWSCSSKQTPFFLHLLESPVCWIFVRQHQCSFHILGRGWGCVSKDKEEGRISVANSVMVGCPLESCINTCFYLVGIMKSNNVENW